MAHVLKHVSMVANKNVLITVHMNAVLIVEHIVQLIVLLLALDVLVNVVDLVDHNLLELHVVDVLLQADVHQHACLIVAVIVIIKVVQLCVVVVLKAHVMLLVE